MSINYPSWVTDDTPIPAGYLIRCKKLLYTIAACEYARLLHNAGWKWFRGEALTPQEEAMLAEEFPGQWPDPPTQAQMENYLENVWEPRQNAAQSTRAQLRMQLTPAQIDFVDWGGLV
ncbi:MAG: hypothetical protein KAX19_02290 [Candidatus Brocadiae bacterium]|nr:hypothetical protein [Candidatus Brocadiia bacterium]